MNDQVSIEDSVLEVEDLTVESRRPGPDEMVSIFASIGLEGSFWDPRADRF